MSLDHILLAPRKGSPSKENHISAISGNTIEDGTSATFTVVLDSEPLDNVSIGVSSDDTSEGSVTPALLSFTG